MRWCKYSAIALYACSRRIFMPGTGAVDVGAPERGPFAFEKR